jgi:RHS repeat-associated protein
LIALETGATRQISVPTSSTASYNANNQVQSTSLMLGGPLGYDAAGDVTQDNQNKYYYDAEGRICEAQSLLTGSMTGYIYDAEGNRVAKGTVQTWGNCNPANNGFEASAETVSILGPGGQQITEMAVDASGTVAWQHSNVWVAGSLIGTYDNNGLHFYFDDWLGTRRAQTDSEGNIEQTCFSLPYGDGENCTPFPTEHLFTGKERDSESGNDYFGARYYASTMGRWLSPDPGWFMFANMLNPQSLNLYNYALDNPLSWIDLDGLELVRVVTATGQSVVVDRSISGNVISLVRAADNAGLMVTITSGFRSTQHQADMYRAWLASGKRGNPVGRPGHSGHNSGQAIDIRTSGMNAAQRSLLGQLGRQNGLPYAGAVDPVHFGAGFGNPVDQGLVAENNANPNPDSTIVDGGETAVVVNETDDTTTIVEDTSNLIEDQITPIDTQNLPLEPQPPDPPPPPPPPPQDQQDQQ